jgi:hypothetical protein
VDGDRFDEFVARIWGRRLRRRQALSTVAGLLAGVTASVLPGRAAAQECPGGTRCVAGGACCTGACCGPTCYDPNNAYCADPRGRACPNGWINCAGPDFAHSTCCRPEECCGGICCGGQWSCCPGSPPRCCWHDEPVCLICADGRALCSTEPVCRNPGEIFDTTICNCRRCEAPLVPCGTTCVLPCGPDQVLDFNTCSCKCLTPCGDACCPLGQECASAGEGIIPPKCCPVGESCAGACRGESGVRCCKAGTLEQGGAACPSSYTCCRTRDGGNTCCRKGKQECVRGRCVKKKGR